MGAVGEVLEKIIAARARGVDVTTEAYPYNAALQRLAPPYLDVIGVGFSILIIRMSNGRRRVSE